MNDIDSLFGATSADEKIENFDLSSAELVLKQIGATPTQAKRLRSEYGSSFGLRWVSDTYFTDTAIWAHRSFDFNVKDFLVNPKKSPVIKAYLDCQSDYDCADKFMVFKAYEVGRMVVTNRAPSRPYIYCAESPNDLPVYVTTFNNLFRDIRGSDFQEIS